MKDKNLETGRLEIRELTYILDGLLNSLVCILAGLDRVERHYLLHVKWLSQVTRHLLPCSLSDPNHAGSVVEKLRSREEELLIRAQRYLLLLWLNRLHLKLQSTAALRTENHLLMVACCLLRVRSMLA